MSNRTDKYQDRARELAIGAGLDPDARIGAGRGRPQWCDFRDLARQEELSEDVAICACEISQAEQPEKYRNSPLKICGDHDANTISQMRNCMSVGNVVAGVICADGHLGYAQPVGGVVAYEKQISISGVGFDIACGNMAVKLDVKFSDISDRIDVIANEIPRGVSFGVGRTNGERVSHEIFDSLEPWRAADMENYRSKAIDQLGTVGSGNHYVDLLRDDENFVWIGVHFGSRGLGHASATKYLKAAGGSDGINVPPAVVDEGSEIGARYIAAMQLAGWYAYAGREWVVERVRKIIGGNVVDTVHNHHNYAWQERHGGRDLWVVRKGATPAFPGQRGFVGGSMGDDAVILQGVDSSDAVQNLYSTMHGAGRLFGRKEAKRRFKREEMDKWIRDRGVTLMGADLDESPMAYRRLSEVLAAHAGTFKILHILHPFVVVMAGTR
jgi:tRNA-splicing ligase RtcB